MALYDTKNIKPITEENILSRTTEYDIFSYYLGHSFIVNSKFNSPLRKDKDPSFGIFVSKITNSLLFKDQGIGESGNCFKFVQLIESLSTYREALEKVNNDLNLGLLSRSKKGIDVKYNYKSSRTKIEIKTRYFTENDDKYWNQYNISRETLKQYRVKPISYIWVNNTLLPWRYSKEYPMYAYQVYNKFKIYRPKNANKEKWLTNCTLYDVQGYEQLPESGELLIITKSLKDVMVLNELNYTSISANSENSIIPKKIMRDLKKRFKNIIIFFDNDNSGIKGAEKFCKTYNLKNIKISTDKGVKDISDFIKKYGKKQTEEYLEKLLKNDK